MTDATWFFLTLGSAALAGGIVAGLVARYLDRHLRDREQAVAAAETELRTKAQETFKAANELVADIAFADEWEQVLAAVETENADTINMPKAGDG